MEVAVEHLGLVIDKEHILEEITLHMESGHIYGFAGRNGSGKTMLMKCICGFIRPTDGQVRVDDRRIGEDLDFPESIGILIETPGFMTHWTGLHNLQYLASIHKKIGKEKICDTIQMVGLDPKLKKAVGKYSLGMRQRLGIAQAIMEDPKLLVLDEPFNGLDADGVEEIRELLQKYKEEGKLIILSSHMKEDLEILCDKVYYLEKGKMKE